MRKLLTAVSPAAGGGRVALAQPVQDAMRVVDHWTTAFNAADVAAIVGLYAPDAQFFGTGSTALVTDHRGIRRYFEAALLGGQQRTVVMRDPAVQVLSDTTVVVAAVDTITGMKDGKRTSAHGRTSFVIGQREAGWQIVHFHRSARPD